MSLNMLGLLLGREGSVGIRSWLVELRDNLDDGRLLLLVALEIRLGESSGVGLEVGGVL